MCDVNFRGSLISSNLLNSHPAQMYQVTPDNIFLIHDELDYAIGKISIKQGGSAK